MSGFAYLIFVAGALLAWGLGAAGAYYYFRARHREAVADLGALDRELNEREEELHRLQYQFTKSNPDGPSRAQLAELEKARDELEQKRNDYKILKQDFDLEIGILKQELEQLRSEESTVEHTRRRIARKSAELKEREALLTEKESDVRERSERLDDDIAARKKHLEDAFAARVRKLDEDLAERENDLRTRRITLEKEREALDRERKSLRKKQEQVDRELLELPVHRFTSPQEALLIKRLRQQIKLQRDELEQLQLLYHRATSDEEVRSGVREDRTNETEKAARLESHEPSRIRAVGTPAAEDEPATPAAEDEPVMPAAEDEPVGSGHGDSFPSFSTLSSYVEGPNPPAAEKESPDDTSRERRVTAGGTEPRDETPSKDDLSSLPGINTHLQDRLYRLGITSFDQIARWSSADVRRVSEMLEIDQKIIQDHWIINAQSHLFSRKGD